MWNVVNVLQFIVYIELIKTNLAVHARMFLIQLKSIALGEFIPYEWISKKFFGATEDLKETSVANKMGTMFLLGIVILIVTIIVLLCGIFRKKLSVKVVRAVDKLKRKLFWNTFIRYTLQSYLKIAFVSIPSLYILTTKGGFEIVSVMFNILLLLALPIVYTVLLYRKRDTMTTESTKEKFGSLFLGIRNLTNW